MSKTSPKSDRFSISEITTPSGLTRWIVSGEKATAGKREQVRKRFKSEKVALESKRILELEALNTESSSQPKITSLTEANLRDAEVALANLKDGFSLTDAVDFFNRNHREVQTEITIMEAVAEFMRDKESRNLRPDTIQNLRNRTGKLALEFGERVTGEISEEDIRNLVLDGDLSPTTRNNDLTVYRDFFGWAARKGYAPGNRAIHVEKIKVDDGEPEILTINQCKAILKAARDFKDGKMLPIITASLFCGLRPNEAKNLDWQKVDLSEAQITVTGGAAKKRKRRIVEIPAVAIEWFNLCPSKKGSFAKKNYRKDLASIRKLTGFRPERLPAERKGMRESTVEKIRKEREAAEKLPRWPKDVMRHTAISMRLAEKNNDNEVALWAGNSADVIHSSYKGLVKKSTTDTFWNLTPETLEKSNVVQMKAS